MNIKVEGIERVVSGLISASADVDSEIESALSRAAQDVSVRMSNEAPEAIGRLKRSMTVESSRKRREIFPLELYGSAQEKGHGPQRMPPASKIQEWAEAKGLSDPKSAAFLIARKIANEGYKANPFISRTFNWTKSQLNRWFDDMANRIVTTYARG